MWEKKGRFVLQRGQFFLLLLFVWPFPRVIKVQVKSESVVKNVGVVYNNNNNGAIDQRSGIGAKVKVEERESANCICANDWEWTHGPAEAARPAEGGGRVGGPPLSLRRVGGCLEGGRGAPTLPLPGSQGRWTHSIQASGPAGHPVQRWRW